MRYWRMWRMRFLLSFVPRCPSVHTYAGNVPGDWTPPSRFVRMAIFKQTLVPPADAEAATLAAIHILNTVDIPYGAICGKDNKDYDFTQWIVVKGLRNKKIYYRTYNDQNIYTAALGDEQLAEGNKTRIIPLSVEAP